MKLNNLPELYTYDIESLPDFFSCCVKRLSDQSKWQFEISNWLDQGYELYVLLTQIANSDGEMVGYNNLFYDYTMLHYLMDHQGRLTAQQLRMKNDQLISAEDRYQHTLWADQRFVKQIDLMAIHHFDNVAKATSLKLLEFNMRRKRILELNLPDGFKTLISTQEMRKAVLHYNWEDVEATEEFLILSLPDIEFRKDLSKKYDMDFTNHNAGKIGTDIFIQELKEAGIRAHKSIQSPRNSVNVGDIILDNIKFEHPALNRQLDIFRNSVVDTSHKEAIKDWFAKNEANFKLDLEGFPVVFGGGGIHASVSSEIIDSDEDNVIIDSDVASYYPNLGIVNGFYPEHLSSEFGKVYQSIYDERKKYPKKTHPMENKALKEALNIPYGKSNDIHSAFLDPKYTISVTVNGQLQLCMLAEQLIKVPELKLIQFNTDGLSYRVPRKYVDHCMSVSDWWEGITGLELEHAHYKRMAVNNVNNYIAVYENGDIKLKGAYNYRNLEMNKDHSALVVPMAAEAAIVHGKSIREFIMSHSDPFDFYLRTKIKRSDILMLVDGDGNETETQRVTRYYISNGGCELVKVSPPTAAMVLNWNTKPHWRHRDNGKHKCANKPPSGKYDQCAPPTPTPEDRRTRINKGFSVTVCNNITEKPSDINYSWYIQEAEKLVNDLSLK